MARESASILTQLGREDSASGTAASGYLTLCSVDLSLSPELDVKKYRAAGKRYPTTSVLNKKWGVGSYEGGASYNELALFLAGLIGPTAQPTTVASGAYGWTFTPNDDGPDSPYTFTARRGDDTAAMVYAFMQVQSLQMKLSRDEVTMSGAVIARVPDNSGDLTTATDEIQAITKSGTVSGGTFTLTYSSQTTGNIAYDATAATIQTALEALSNIAPGDVVVSGGPISTGRVHVRFTGTLAGTNVSAMTADSTNLTGGGSYAVTTLLAGGASVSQIAESPISGNEVSVYVDTTSGGLGGTQLGCPMEVRINLPERVKPKWCLNASQDSFTELVGVATEPTIEIDMEYSSAAQTLYDAVVTDSLPTRYIRVQATGAEITGGTNYLARLDFAASIASAKELKDADGVYGFTFAWNIKNDSTWGKPFNFYCVNTLAYL